MSRQPKPSRSKSEQEQLDSKLKEAILALGRCSYSDRQENIEQINRLEHEATRLLEKGANANIEDPNELSLLYHALSADSALLFEKLLRHGAKLDTYTKEQLQRTGLNSRAQHRQRGAKYRALSKETAETCIIKLREEGLWPEESVVNDDCDTASISSGGSDIKTDWGRPSHHESKGDDWETASTTSTSPSQSSYSSASGGSMLWEEPVKDKDDNWSAESYSSIYSNDDYTDFHSSTHSPRPQSSGTHTAGHTHRQSAAGFNGRRYVQELECNIGYPRLKLLRNAAKAGEEQAWRASHYAAIGARRIPKHALTTYDTISSFNLHYQRFCETGLPARTVGALTAIAATREAAQLANWAAPTKLRSLSASSQRPANNSRQQKRRRRRRTHQRSVWADLAKTAQAVGDSLSPAISDLSNYGRRFIQGLRKNAAKAALPAHPIASRSTNLSDDEQLSVAASSVVSGRSFGMASSNTSVISEVSDDYRVEKMFHRQSREGSTLHSSSDETELSPMPRYTPRQRQFSADSLTVVEAATPAEPDSPQAIHAATPVKRMQRFSVVEAHDKVEKTSRKSRGFSRRSRPVDDWHSARPSPDEQDRTASHRSTGWQQFRSWIKTKMSRPEKAPSTVTVARSKAPQRRTTVISSSIASSRHRSAAEHPDTQSKRISNERQAQSKRMHARLAKLESVSTAVEAATPAEPDSPQVIHAATPVKRMQRFSVVEAHDKVEKTSRKSRGFSRRSRPVDDWQSARPSPDEQDRTASHRSTGWHLPSWLKASSRKKEPAMKSIQPLNQARRATRLKQLGIEHSSPVIGRM